jgi:ferredoxin
LETYVYTGPKFAIDAIAAGKQGAVSIHRYVQKGQSLVIGRDRREYHSLEKDNLDLGNYDRQPRQKADHREADHQEIDHREVNKSMATFKDPRLTFTEEQLQKETKRCLSCGAAVVDEFQCVGCGACTTRCKFDAITLIRKYDGEGVALENLKPIVVKQILKRKGKIAIKKAINVFRKD